MSFDKQTGQSWPSSRRDIGILPMDTGWEPMPQGKPLPKSLVETH